MIASLLLLLVPPAGMALGLEEPEHIPWTEVLLPLPSQHEATEETICVEGFLRCVDLTVRQMDARLQQLATGCDHDAVFALVYLRTTEEFRRAVTEPGFFEDPAFLNHWATVFADYYFRAYDGWHQGEAEHVPPAWRIAFEAADARAVSGSGNMLLGINAHINRDLPFVLANIGMRAPDGSSRKGDHDRVNVFLRRVVEPARAEAAQRFDPTMDDAAVEDTTLLDTATFQTVVTWREEAWRKAELLAGAPPLLRPLVAQEIEDEAAALATAIRTQAAYETQGGGADERDEHCDEHWRG